MDARADRPRLREERDRHRLLGRARPVASGARCATLLGGRLTESFPLYFAVPLGPAEEMTAYVEARRAEGIHRFQLKIGADPLRGRGARTRSVVEATGPRGYRRRRRERRLAAAGRRRRGARDRGARPCLLRAAVPDDGGVPDRAPADDAADGARRVHPRRALAAPCARGARARGVQPEDLEGRRADAREADARPRRGARPAGDDRGHLGRRPRDRRRVAPRGEHAAGHAVHCLVHERLDERARRRPRAAVAGRVWFGAGSARGSASTWMSRLSAVRCFPRRSRSRRTR